MFASSFIFLAISFILCFSSASTSSRIPSRRNFDPDRLLTLAEGDFDKESLPASLLRLRFSGLLVISSLTEELFFDDFFSGVGKFFLLILMVASTIRPGFITIGPLRFFMASRFFIAKISGSSSSESSSVSLSSSTTSFSFLILSDTSSARLCSKETGPLASSDALPLLVPEVALSSLFSAAGSGSC